MPRTFYEPLHLDIGEGLVFSFLPQNDGNLMLSRALRHDKPAYLTSDELQLLVALEEHVWTTDHEHPDGDITYSADISLEGSALLDQFLERNRVFAPEKIS